MTRPSSQLVLMAWFSPAFPVGGFAFSHGIEWAYEAGHISNREQLQGWLQVLLTAGSGYNDAILLAETYRAMLKLVANPAEETLTDIIDLAAALQPTSERYLEANVQGTAFFKAVALSWPHAAFTSITPEMAERLTYPVATGLAAAAHDLALEQTVNAYLQAFIANLVSASVRLGIVGQTDGQRVMAALIPLMPDIAAKALQSTIDDLGNTALRADMMSFHHETQYSRLFRS